MYEGLKSDEVIRTVDQLSKRIGERFPESGLQKVSKELLDIAKQAQARAIWIARPRFLLRLAVGLLIVAMVAVITGAVVRLHPEESRFDFGEFVGVLEAGMNVVILFGVTMAFLVTLERRVKRTRALQAVHELRSIAHVIDMHQLTKDPDQIFGDAPATPSDPAPMSPADLGRYLDYCSEMLSLVGKVAAVYVQRFDDSVAIASVNEVETLATGLTRKIWQKLMILHSFKA